MSAIELSAKTVEYALPITELEPLLANVSAQLDLKANIVKRNVSYKKKISISIMMILSHSLSQGH